MSRKKLSVLGSTGSIGTQTLDVVRNDLEHFQVAALAAGGSRLELLARQTAEFHPELVCVYDEKRLPDFKALLRQEGVSLKDVSLTTGMEGLKEASAISSADMTVTAMVGMIGIEPTLAAIEAGKDIALANKETLACAGQLVMDEARKKKVRILPVDSEHAAVFQCLRAVRRSEVSCIWLTASGGPFRGYSKEQLEKVTLEQALHHPNWQMGAKITIDSATLMNKGTEMIEAMFLYSLRPGQILPVVHPQSIVHSMVEMQDGTVLAQLGPTDMRLPIQVMLNYPRRGARLTQRLDFYKLGALTFEPIDESVFVSIPLARECMEKGGLFPACYNAANEIAVEKFRNQEIGFTDIFRLVGQAVEGLEREESTMGSSREYEMKEIVGMRDHVARLLKEHT